MTYKNSSEILSFIDSSSPSKQSAEFLTQAVKDEKKSERVLIFLRESVKDDRLTTRAMLMIQSIPLYLISISV